CAWQNAGETGTQWNYLPNRNQPFGFWWFVGSAANDKISSIHNGAGTHRAWVAKNCVADAQNTRIAEGATAADPDNNNGPDGSSMNDSISAWGQTPQSAGAPAHGSRTAGGC